MLFVKEESKQEAGFSTQQQVKIEFKDFKCTLQNVPEKVLIKGISISVVLFYTFISKTITLFKSSSL